MKRWTPECSAILERNSDGATANYHDWELRNMIWAETQIRLDEETIARYRRAAGIARCKRNDWTAPLRRLARTSRVGA